MTIDRIVMLIVFVGTLYLIFKIPKAYVAAYGASIRSRFGAGMRMSLALMMLVIGPVVMAALLVPDRFPLLGEVAPALVLASAAVLAFDNYCFWRACYRKEK